MELMTVIRKAAGGEPLTDEEKSFLGSYQVPTRPESERNRELTATIEQLTAKIETLENQNLAEPDRRQKELTQLKKNIELLTRERDGHRDELNKIKFRSQVAEIAGHYNFNDPEYLEFLVGKSQVAIDDQEQIKEFMGRVREELPRHFKIELRPGSGSNPAPGSAADFTNAQQSGDVMQMLCHAPEIKN